MTVLLYILFTCLAATTEIIATLDNSMLECKKKCVCNRDDIVFGCISMDNTTVILESDVEIKKQHSRLICKGCFNTAKLIMKIKKKYGIYKTFSYDESNLNKYNFVAAEKQGILGIRLFNGFYLVAVDESNKQSLVDVFVFYKLQESERGGQFTLKPTEPLPKNPELVGLMHFQPMDDVFYLYEILHDSEEEQWEDDIEFYVGNVSYIYYFSALMATGWLGLLLFNNRDILKKLFLKNPNKTE